jgi:hypothetical protein
MTFKNTEKEILKAIVEYGGEVKSLAEVLNKSQLLEKRGIVIVPNKNPNFIFLSKERYDEEEKDALGYVTELVSLIDSLIKKRLIISIPYKTSPVLVVGKEKSEYGNKPGMISINDGKEFVIFRNEKWAELVSPLGEQTHWIVTCTDEYVALEKIMNSWFTVSAELKDLVIHNFKSEDERRYSNQVILTWISIIVAICIGLLSYCK